MERVYLDCTGLRNISVDKGDLPNSIYIDGNDFLQRLSSTLQEAQWESEADRKKRERWELVKALASNPKIICGGDYKADAYSIIHCADAIIEQLENREGIE